MTEINMPIQPEAERVIPKARTGFIARVVKYTLVRMLALGLMLIIGMFLAVIVLNFGGFIDQIYRANIEEALGWMGAGMKGATYEEKMQVMGQARYAMEEAAGLHTPSCSGVYAGPMTHSASVWEIQPV
jgi:hypothetical protein